MRKLAKVTAKHLNQDLYFHIVAISRPADWLKRTPIAIISTKVCNSFRNSFFYRAPVKAATWGVLWKKLLFKVSHYSQETPVLESLLNKATNMKSCHFIKKRLQHRYFTKKNSKFLVSTYPVKTRRFFICQGNATLYSFSICAKLHMFPYNRWTTWYKLNDVHIFESQGIVGRVSQFQSFISHFYTVAWGLNFILLI